MRGRAHRVLDQGGRHAVGGEQVESAAGTIRCSQIIVGEETGAAEADVGIWFAGVGAEWDGVELVHHRDLLTDFADCVVVGSRGPVVGELEDSDVRDVLFR